MTEREWLKSKWLKSTGLGRLLDRLCRSKRLRPSDRRLRLFAAGFWRWQAGNADARMKPESAERLLGAVTLAEQWAEGGARPEGMSAFRHFIVAKERASTAAKETAVFPRERNGGARARERVPPLFRCVFGNPFRPVQLGPGWVTPTVAGLAQAAYDERLLPEGDLDPARLAVLADTLEEAGCSVPDILAHLRGPGPHVRGCWAVDLILGKQ
jgi:hypothetical protein